MVMIKKRAENSPVGCNSISATDWPWGPGSPAMSASIIGIEGRAKSAQMKYLESRTVLNMLALLVDGQLLCSTRHHWGSVGVFDKRILFNWSHLQNGTVLTLDVIWFKLVKWCH